MWKLHSPRPRLTTRDTSSKNVFKRNDAGLPLEGGVTVTSLAKREELPLAAVAALPNISKMGCAVRQAVATRSMPLEGEEEGIPAEVCVGVLHSSASAWRTILVASVFPAPDCPVTTTTAWQGSLEEEDDAFAFDAEG